MSTRECSRCGETCHGCDNQDDPHLCESCKEKDVAKTKTKTEYSRDVAEILDLARHDTVRFHHDYVGTEHILLGLARHPAGEKLLVRLGTTEQAVRKRVEQYIQSSPSMTVTPTSLPFTPRSKRVLEFASEAVILEDAEVVQVRHLLAGLIREEGLAAQVLRDLGVTLAKCNNADRRERTVVPPTSELVLTVTKVSGVTSVDAHTDQGFTSVKIDPPAVLWLVTLNDGIGEWRETYGSEAEKNAFIRGATAAMHGNALLKVVETEQ